MNLGIDEAYAEDYQLIHPFTFWFRPEPVREAISVAYNKMRVMGQSHQYHNYEGTDNVPITFELYVNRLMLLKAGAISTERSVRSSTRTGTIEGTLEDLQRLSWMIEEGKRYLQALCYSPEGSAGIIGNSPPPCLLVMPGILELRCRLMGADFNHTECDTKGNITEMRVRCTFEEAPLGRITMQDVLERGSFRTWGLT